MNEERFDAAISGMQHGVLEQPATEAARARLMQDGYAELGHERSLPRRRRYGVGQVGHRDEIESPIEDAEHLILLEVEQVHVLGDLCIGGWVAKPKVAITFIQR